MNILQILPSLDVGGVETGTVDLARYLVQNGHKAVVVSSGGVLVKELDIARVRHYVLPVDRKNPITAIRMVGEVCEIIRRDDIDIVHARSRVPAWIAFFAARIVKKPFVTTAHGHYSRHPLSEVMGWGRLVIVASSVMARHMVQTFAVPRSRIRLVPRGLDLTRFPMRTPETRGTAEFTVGIIARITPLKGHPDFLKAVGMAAREIPRLRAVIVGDVPKGKEKYREELELLTRRLGLSRTVEFLGVRQDIPSVLTELDVLVSSTVTHEAFGRSIIEAQAAGVPVVATRVGGVVDVIDDGVNGLLCGAEDPRGLADAILRLYRDEDLRKTLALNGRKNVEERFTLQRMAQETVKVYEEAMRQVNILVIKMSSIGDCILSIPSLRALRAHFPDAKIKVLVGVPSREVFNNCPYIDDRIVCDLKGNSRGPAGLWRLGRLLQQECFDIVVDLQNNKKSHLLAYVSLAGVRCGYDNGKWSFFLNRKAKDGRAAIDPLAHQLKVLGLLGIAAMERSLELFPAEEDVIWAEEFLRSNWVKPAQPLVGINVKASARWFSKNWPIEHASELADRLAAKNIRTVITGARSEAGAADALCRMTKSRPIVAAGKTSVLQLAALMRRLSCFVTPDSAPLHIATCMHTPVIGLFGPTDPSRHFVPSAHSTTIRKDMACSPCYSPHCLKGFRCMRKIGADEVFEAVMRVLAQAGPRDAPAGQALPREEGVRLP